MSKSKKAGSLLDTLNEKIELPQGLLSGGVHIEINSDREATVDGRCSVIQYDENEIRLNTQTGTLTFFGSSMNIVALDPQFVEIRGKICRVEFSG